MFKIVVMEINKLRKNTPSTFLGLFQKYIFQVKLTSDQNCNTCMKRLVFQKAASFMVRMMNVRCINNTHKQHRYNYGQLYINYI